jgi:hypothetical protein
VWREQLLSLENVRGVEFSFFFQQRDNAKVRSLLIGRLILRLQETRS